MKNHFIYPCVFEQAQKNVSFYFPDFPGFVGSHENIEKGLPVARNLLAEAILQYEAEGKELPSPSDPKDIELYDPTDRIVYVEIWMQPYRDEAANKAVTKNCTLPKWLRDAGEAAGLNFSQLLQTAIKEALGIKETR
ncbi:type II toxin-antitoxin system HicB family antitoxin [Thermoactinomyces sp. CICC 10521]|uniref:type II toxin-antitoxin system HicB family antitoxin n=1 Tax=Thermoactinomyces sp. CICC 10521 TaxID=2767426 RepID=UPI0018DCA4C8|nr:type II toxin-antitoxin system HicB family antitoxin [Thermoactinomyces sp. CICC 10521]MBH8606005.1 type II toxin-antitoxin system HicB family antitoxin [Thermoactinomyces sp. CICC 10521]